MKKGLIGCLLVGLVLIVAGAGAAYWFIVRPMFDAGSAVVEGARDWAKAVDAEQAVRNQAQYAPPADGRLTQEQVNRFAAVQGNVQLRLGPEFDELKRLYEQMQSEQAAVGRKPDLNDAMGAVAGLAPLVARAREAQVEALNAQGMSLSEYRWIRDQAYAALPFIDLDPDAIVAPKPPPGAAVDAATGEVIEIPEEVPLEAIDPADAMAADAAATATPAEDEGLEYAGTAPDEPDLLPSDTVFPADQPKPQKKTPVDDGLAETVKDRGLGDDSRIDTAEQQAARANAVLLRPHKDLLLRTLGTSWVGL
jgi:hypothetical protein